MPHVHGYKEGELGFQSTSVGLQNASETSVLYQEVPMAFE